MRPHPNPPNGNFMRSSSTIKKTPEKVKAPARFRRNGIKEMSANNKASPVERISQGAAPTYVELQCSSGRKKARPAKEEVKIRSKSGLSDNRQNSKAPPIIGSKPISIGAKPPQRRSPAKTASGNRKPSLIINAISRRQKDDQRWFPAHNLPSSQLDIYPSPAWWVSLSRNLVNGYQQRT